MCSIARAPLALNRGRVALVEEPAGTEQRPPTRQTHAATRSSNLGYGLDPGMSKRVTASITFVDSATNQLQAANNTFTPFAVGDNIPVDGANLNNTIEAVVTAIDATTPAVLTP